METEKVVVILLVISIVLSALSLVTILTLNSDISGFSFPDSSRVTNTNTLTNNAGPDVTSVGVTILPIGGGP